MREIFKRENFGGIGNHTGTGELLTGGLAYFGRIGGVGEMVAQGG